VRWAGQRWAGARWAGEAWSGGVVGAPDGVTTTFTMPACSPLGPEHYWPAREGRAGHTYLGAVVLLGTDRYVYWTQAGVGLDPAPAGRTGHVVDLAAGIRTGAQVATATVAVLASVPGWGNSSADGAALSFLHSSATATVGATWDAATPGAMIGTRATTGTHEGPITTPLAQHLPNPGLDLPIVAIDVLIGAVADTADRWRGVLYTAGAGVGSPEDETREIDLGQLAADQVVAGQWARWYLPPAADVRANQALWVGVKGEVGVTTVRGRLTGNPTLGDWTVQNLVESDGTIDPDATVAWPATWTGAAAPQNPFLMNIRLVVAGTVGNASHHSSADPAIWGVHVEVAALTSTIDFNSNLACVGTSPALEGMLLHDLGFAVGTVRGTQPRVGVFTGGVLGVEPVDPDGASLLVDGGRLVGSSTSAWEYVSLAATPWPASTITSWWVKNNDDASGTTIAFAQDPDQATASPDETPMDFPTAETSPGSFGPEYEIFPADSSYNVTNPAVTFVSPFVADPDDARPRNVPGARLRFYIPGITVSTP
jgi:hypothetical protein